jgi:uncharacterized membrane protein YbhN (UPF0104 family)
MNHDWKRWAWPVGKTLLALAILAGVGRQFYQDLNQPGLASLPWRPGWLLLCGALYLLFLGCSASFWYWLLHRFGARPALATAARAYYIGQLGKYVPGKAWALLLRGTLARGPNVRLGVAILSALYEVLTTMAAGALVAAIGFLILPPQSEEMHWHPLLVGVGLLVLCLVPLLPGVFNFLVGRMAARFQRIESFRLPRLGGISLAEGLLLTALGWGLLGLSVWTALEAVLPEPPPCTWVTWVKLTAAIAFAYVAGFLAIVVPGGVGVREYFLLTLLAFAGPIQAIAAAVLLLRFTWTTAELLAAAGVFFLKAPDS